MTGSWCPNCHDEAPFLASLYRSHRGRGLEIVALAFEEADQLKNPTRVRGFIKQFGLEYPFLLAGTPEQAAEKIPQAVNLTTFPATFVLGRDGRGTARSMPATPARRPATSIGRSKWRSSPRSSAFSPSPPRTVGCVIKLGVPTCPGEVAEWSKAGASKASVRETVPGVQIPPSPPTPSLRSVVGGSGRLSGFERLASPLVALGTNPSLTHTRLRASPSAGILRIALRTNPCFRLRLSRCFHVQRKSPLANGLQRD